MMFFDNKLDFDLSFLESAIDLAIFKEWVLIISGIGTFVSAIIAAITVVEIKKQRQSSYMPDLILDTYTAYCYWNRSMSNEDDVRFRFTRSQYNVWNEENKKEKEQIYILYKLQNIGLGVAKYVKCEWSFDYAKAVARIKPYLPDDYVLREKTDNLMLMRGEDEYLDFIFFSDLDNDYVDFILPETLSENKKDSSIPDLVLKLHLYYFIFKYKVLDPPDLDSNMEDFIDFPKLYLDIQCMDIRNKLYKKRFSISFQFIDFEKDEQKISSEFGIFYINVKENS